MIKSLVLSLLSLALVACNQQSTTPVTSAPAPVITHASVTFKCVPTQRMNVINGVEGEWTPITGAVAVMTTDGYALSIYDAEMELNHEFGERVPAGQSNEFLGYRTFFTYGGKQYEQRLTMEKSFVTMSKFEYVRGTYMTANDGTPLTVRLSGFCTKI